MRWRAATPIRSSSSRFAPTSPAVATPQEDELVLAHGLLGALALREREDEGEEAARREDARGGARVVGDGAADLDPRRHRLRMRGLDGRAGRKVRRRAGDEIERRV